jgi:hypothetical protein
MIVVSVAGCLGYDVLVKTVVGEPATETQTPFL